MIAPRESHALLMSTDIRPFNNPPLTFPWRPKGTSHLWVDGHAFYPRMLTAIHEAQRFILLETYLVESGALLDEFMEALIAASTRGVEVRVLLDAFGAMGMRAEDRAACTRGGIAMRFYNPLDGRRPLLHLARNHRKLLVIDGERAFTGGAGLTDAFDTRLDASGWHDFMLESTGAIVEDWSRLFYHTWRCAEAPPRPPIRAAWRRHSTPAAGTATTRLNTSVGWGLSPLKDELARRSRHARHRVWLATAYFLPTGALRRALAHAARHNVDVRILVPGPISDHPAVRHAGRRHYGHLLRAGVRIYEYQARFSHMKLAIADDWSSLGSCNFDRWNIRWNLEANQETVDDALARTLADLFLQDVAQSHEITREAWQSRSLWTRLREGFWYRIAYLLERLAQRWGRSR